MNDRTFLFGTTVVWSSEHREAFTLATGKLPPVTTLECLRLLKAVPQPLMQAAGSETLAEADVAASVCARLAEQLRAELLTLDPRLSA